MKVLRQWMIVAGVFTLLVLSAGPLQTQDPANKAAMPVEEMVKKIQEAPVLAENSFYYDNGFRAVGSFAIHDHVGKRICMGYLVSDGKRLAYRYIRAMPGLGSSNDAFETEITNIATAKYKFFEASLGMMDYYPERLSVEMTFRKPIVGLLAKWEKKEMNFDIWDIQFGNRLMAHMKAAGVEAIPRN